MPALLLAAGVSLGGNALLKWLGEQRDDARAVVQGAAAISAPVDLHAAGRALEQGFNMVYTRNFLATMKRKSLAKLRMHPGLFDAARLRATRTLREFDDLVTSRLHGFDGVDDYYTRASSKPYLAFVSVPTLLLNARNDPFLPAAALPELNMVSAAVLATFPDEGGHVGFPDARSSSVVCGESAGCSPLPGRCTTWCASAIWWRLRHDRAKPCGDIRCLP